MGIYMTSDDEFKKKLCRSLVDDNPNTVGLSEEAKDNLASDMLKDPTVAFGISAIYETRENPYRLLEPDVVAEELVKVSTSLGTWLKPHSL